VGGHSFWGAPLRVVLGYPAPQKNHTRTPPELSNLETAFDPLVARGKPLPLLAV